MGDRNIEVFYQIVYESYDLLIIYGYFFLLVLEGELGGWSQDGIIQSIGVNVFISDLYIGIYVI